MSDQRLTAEREQEIRDLADATTSTVFARALNNALAALDAVRGERDGAIAGAEQALENAARDIKHLTRALDEATKIDPNSRSHECRECRGGLRKPLKDCPDCCGTAVEGTGLRRQIIALTRERDEARKDSARLDWLEQDQGRRVYPHDGFEGKPWACGERAYDSLRFAIDDGMSWPHTNAAHA